MRKFLSFIGSKIANMHAKKRLMILGILSYVIYAIAATEIGPAIPGMRSELKLDEAIIGFVVSLQSLAGVLAVFGGFLSDRFGKPMIIALSLGIMGVGALMLSSLPLIWLLGAAFFILGVGIGFFEASINAFISEIYHEKRGMAINLLHIGWGIGSTAGPLFMTLVILSYGTWRLGYFVIFPILAAASIMFLIYTKTISSHVSIKDSKGGSTKIESSIVVRFLPLMMIAFLLVFCQLGMSNWLPSLLIDQGSSITEAGLTVGIFWALIGIGRVIWAPFVDKFRYWRVIFLTGFGGAALMLLASTSIPVQVKTILWASSGLLLAPAYPTIIAWATATRPEAGGTLSGAVYTFATLGSFVSTLLVGLLFSSLGSTTAQLVFPLSMILVAATSYIFRNLGIGGDIA
ncbi:MAG: MFS transporter [Aigarchaeota archaeon]|nr:MFS transporter [Aigarchaeota archaeon]